MFYVRIAFERANDQNGFSYVAILNLKTTFVNYIP